MHLCSGDAKEVREAPLDLGAPLAPDQQERHLELRGPFGDMPALVAQVLVEILHVARDSESPLVGVSVVSFIKVVDELDALVGHEIVELVERLERRSGLLDGALGILVAGGCVNVRAPSGNAGIRKVPFKLFVMTSFRTRSGRFNATY